MVWYPRQKPKLKENFTGVVYTFIQSAIIRHFIRSENRVEGAKYKVQKTTALIQIYHY